MHIVHVSQYCHTSSIGGTERYILELFRALRRHGVESCIAWMKVGDLPAPHEDDEGFSIIPLPAGAMRADPPPPDLSTLAARRVFEAVRPDLVHFHTFGRSEAAVAREARRRGIPYIFTYHSPAWSCRRETLLRWGKHLCDGEIRALRCSACKLQERLDCPPWVAWLAAVVSLPLGLVGRFAGGKLRRRTAFVSESGFLRDKFRGFLRNADRVVACCEWSIPLLGRNGAAQDQIVLCPQGVPQSSVVAANIDRQNKDDSTRGGRATFIVGYVGRLTPVKGIHIVAEAFVKISYPDARLRIYGWSPDDHVDAYSHKVAKLAKDDARVEFIGKLPFDSMVDEYRKLDLLVIPSVCMETGPLTLLEALQSGVTVWGSSNIGQIEALRRAGKVVEPNTVSAWHAALLHAFETHRSGAWQKVQTQKVRTMAEVALEMRDVYQQVLV